MAAEEKKRIVVEPAHKGVRLDQFLSLSLPELSRSRLKQLIEHGLVLIDGSPCKAGQRLRGVETVDCIIPAPTPSHASPENLPLNILYQDADLIVIDKASGVVVHPAAGHWTGTLVNGLLHHVRDLDGVGGELRPGIVHRLDKDTSGCLIVAKNEFALNGLQAAFKNREVEKVYLALVHGRPPLRGTFSTLHGRHPKDRKRFSGKVKVGKPAVTHFQMREVFSESSLVEINLETGRTHQIRVHFSEAGFPLLGDPLYGGTRKGKGRLRELQSELGRTALHAWRLQLKHPRTGKPLLFEAPLPIDLIEIIEQLRDSD